MAAFALVACGSDGVTPRAGSTTPSIGSIASLVPSATPTRGPGGKASPASASKPSPSPTDPGASPAPLDPSTIDDDVPVEAFITPSCVLRGGTAKITINTQPKNAVAYHAVYAGTKGGAPPPFGYGYGGDDRGHANGEGVYTSTWVVRIDAPVGPARADVIAADGQSFGYDDPPFYVAASSAGCPA
ncbi:MAG TPA: hypothetical protein VJ922_04895 [Actinomycetota bacterium]|nr:hypothetical protein [Actinomycetota bacterium]